MHLIDIERFIERAHVPKPEMLNTGWILFENYSKRKPFVQSPKDYSKKPCKHLTQKRSYYKPKLKLNNIELYRSDRILMDPGKVQNLLMQCL